MIELIIMGFLIGIFILQIWILLLHRSLIHDKDTECYTDYVHKNVVLRVFKPEFEYQAISIIPRDKLLDRGNLSQFYMWVLFER